MTAAVRLVETGITLDPWPDCAPPSWTVRQNGADIGTITRWDAHTWVADECADPQAAQFTVERTRREAVAWLVARAK